MLLKSPSHASGKSLNIIKRFCAIDTRERSDLFVCVWPKNLGIDRSLCSDNDLKLLYKKKLRYSLVLAVLTRETLKR